MSKHKGWKKFDFVLNKCESYGILYERRQSEGRWGRQVNRAGDEGGAEAGD